MTQVCRNNEVVFKKCVKTYKNENRLKCRIRFDPHSTKYTYYETYIEEYVMCVVFSYIVCNLSSRKVLYGRFYLFIMENIITG